VKLNSFVLVRTVARVTRSGITILAVAPNTIPERIAKIISNVNPGREKLF